MAEKLLKRKKPEYCSKYLSTGSTLLDLAISDTYPGGVQAGRIVHIYGANSTAKSVLVAEILGSCQRSAGTAVLADAEYTFDFDRAKLFGLDVGKWSDEEIRMSCMDKEQAADGAPKDMMKKRMVAYRDNLRIDKKFACVHPSSVEAFFDICVAGAIEAAKDKDINTPICLGVDSMSSIPSETELKDSLDKSTYAMSRAKQFSAGFRKYLSAISNSNMSLIVIDQTRDAVGEQYKTHTVSGGNAIKFYSSTSIFLKKATNIKNKYEQNVGILLKFDIEKNKVSAPHRTGTIRLLFDVGIDDVGSNLEWLTDKAVADKVDSKVKLSGSWYSFEGEESIKLGQGLDKACMEIEERGMEKMIEQEVVRVWKILYEPSTRKNRHLND